MPRKKGQKTKPQNALEKTLTTDELIKVIDDSGIGITVIEKGIGMPQHTLYKIYHKTPDKTTGYVRSLPAKWELPLLNYIKQKKALIKDTIEETLEVREEVGLDPILEPEVDIPDLDRKLDWINKLQEVKNEFDLNNKGT